MNRAQRREAAARGIAKALLSLDNDAARAVITGKRVYSLRSHEKLSKNQFGDGIAGFDVTYEILKDGKALSFSEHMDVIALLNALAAKEWK